MSKFLINKSTLDNIANAILRIFGLSNPISTDEMTENLNTIERKTEADITTTGPTVTVPAGYYAADSNKTIANGNVEIPDISVSNNGVITATSEVTEGYVNGTDKTNTYELTTQAAATITPTKSTQTAVAANKYTTGEVKVAPIPNSYITTTDANATDVDIVVDKTAYVNGAKITGSNPYVKTATDTEVANQTELIAELQSILEEKTQLDTNDATATAADIAAGKTAYISNGKVTGTLEEIDLFSGTANSLWHSPSANTINLQSSVDEGDLTNRKIYTRGATISASASIFGDATAADVAEGKFFTSSAGLRVAGTNSGGLDTTPAYTSSIIRYAADTYYFERCAVSGYTDYYESNNKDKHSTYAYSEFEITVNSTCNVLVDIWYLSEQNYDWAQIDSQLNGTAITRDTTKNSVYNTSLGGTQPGTAYTFSGSGQTVLTYSNITPGTYRLKFKYFKDSSASSTSNGEGDSLRIRVRPAPIAIPDEIMDAVLQNETECIPSNIRSGATILGVEGTYVGSTSSSINVSYGNIDLSSVSSYITGMYRTYITASGVINSFNSILLTCAVPVNTLLVVVSSSGLSFSGSTVLGSHFLYNYGTIYILQVGSGTTTATFAGDG